MLQKLRNKYKEIEVCDAKGNSCRQMPESSAAKSDTESTGEEDLFSGGSSSNSETAETDDYSTSESEDYDYDDLRG